MFQAPETDTDPTAGGGFKAPEDDLEPKSLAGFGKNAIEDVKDTAKGIVDLGAGLVGHPVDTVKNIPGALVNEGKRIGLGELLTGHPINAAEKFGNAAYDKPLSTLMDVAPVVGAAGKALGIGGAAAEGADAAEMASKAAQASSDAEKAAGVIPIERAIGNTVTRDPMAAGAAQESAKIIPKLAPEEEAPKIPPAATPAPAQPSITDSLANDAMAKGNELKDYISKGYEGYAKKPGAAADIADYVQEKSQMMAAQQMGATPLQARQIGHEGMRALGQYALDNEIVGPTVGENGMRARTTQLNNAAGETIGAIRKEADALRVPAEHNVDVLQAIRKKFDPIFARGSRSGEAGAYAKALEDLEDAKPTFQGMAELSTKLNKAANEANRLNQPHGAFTDIANEVSRINNERIKALVGPEKAAQYEQALRDYGATKKIGEFLKRKEAGEVKRLGPGSLTSNLVQKAMDEFGYRAGAKIANKVSSAIKRNPSIAKTIPSIFKEFINQVEDTNHEVTGLAHGGIVPDDVKQWINARGC